MAHLHVTSTRLTIEAPGAVLRELRKELRYVDAASPTGWRELLTVSRQGDVATTRPGLTHRVAHWLGERGVEFDLTAEPESVQPDQGTEIVLRAYQEEARRAVLRHRRGILKGAPRVGKTAISASLIDSLPAERPALFLVERLELREQAAVELSRWLRQPVRAGAPKLGDDVVVCTVQTLSRGLERYRDWLRSVRLVVADECHHSSAATHWKVIKACANARRVYGLSATPFRADSTDLLLEANVGPIVHRIGHSAMIREVDPVTGSPYLVRPLVIFEKMERIPLDRNLTWQECYTEAIVNNHSRNLAASDFARHVRDVGRTCTVIVNRIEHGETLARLIGCPFTHGEMPLDERLSILERLRDRDEPVVVSTLYKEAIDIPSLDAVVNAAGMNSAIQFYQVMRNLTRWPGKHVAPLLDFHDQSRYTLKWYNGRRAVCDDEEEFAVVEREDYLHGGRCDWSWLDPYLTGERDAADLLRREEILT